MPEGRDRRHRRFTRAAGAPRQMANRSQWGVNILTCRSRDNQVSGYQMTCTRPDHNLERRCAQEISNMAAGSEELALRYVLEGLGDLRRGLGSEAAHRQEAWESALDGQESPSWMGKPSHM